MDKPIKHLILGSGWRDRACVPEDTITLDINPDVQPNILWDLELLPYPFDDDEFDSITAHQVLEHTGEQGNHRFFFGQWSELWRILKPGGRITADVPRWDGIWAFGDPSHKRVINTGSLAFLHQPNYVAQQGRTAMTDFRRLYQADFDIASAAYDDDNFYFQLIAVKPSRYTR